MSETAVMRIIFRSILTVITLAALTWFAWTVRSVLILLLVSIILAVGLSPIVNAIAGHKPERRFLRLPRLVAALILYAGLFLLIALAIVGLIPHVVDQAQDFAMKVPVYAEDIRQHVSDLESAYPALSGIESQLISQVTEILGGIGDMSSQVSKVLRLAMGVVNGVFTGLMLLVFTFYLIIDGEGLSRRIIALLPQASQRTAMAVTDRVRVKIASWLIGQLVLGVSIGITTFVGLRLLGIPFALFLAVVAAIGELIPMVGPILAAVPAVIVAFQISPTMGFLTIGLYVVIQQLENHILAPQIMRRAVDLPPVVIMAALLMGFEFLGIIGAVLALPVAAAIGVVLGELLTLRAGNTQPSPRMADEASKPIESVKR